MQDSCQPVLCLYFNDLNELIHMVTGQVSKFSTVFPKNPRFQELSVKSTDNKMLENGINTLILIK